MAAFTLTQSWDMSGTLVLITVSTHCEDDLNVAGSTWQTLLFQQELLSDMIGGDGVKSCMQRLCLLTVHLITWATCLTSISLGTMAVHFLSEVRGSSNCCAARHDKFHAHLSSCRMQLAFSQHCNKNNSLTNKHLPTAVIYFSFFFPVRCFTLFT